MPDQSLSIETADGVTLEAELRSPEPPEQPVATAVLCHPHPLYGGEMHNNVVSGLFDHLPTLGVACLRFNFRGAGASGGAHDGGTAERHDVVAAVAELAARWPDVPLLLAGYSFGGDVALAVTDHRIAGWLAVAPPLRVVPVDQMGAGSDGRPVRIATGTADDFRPPDEARRVTAGWQACEVVEVPGADHFFGTGMDTVRQVAADAVAALTGA